MINLDITRMSALSWKARHRNGGYWRETWKRCSRKGCKWEHRLRWQRVS